MNLIKPNTLVHVNLRATLGYAFIGEVMSFETPDHTAMIRRVPGHPCTLVELPVNGLSTVEKSRAKFVHYAAVSSREDREDRMFPVDMLRYDCAAPVNFEIKADEFHGTVATVADPSFGFGTERVIACVSQHRDPERAFCKARWSSFLRGIRFLHTESL